MSTKKVLIITYYWPPSGGVGIQRWMYFAVNLKKLGWEPLIYTPSNPQFEIHDEKLLEITKEIQVIRKPIWEPFSIFHKITGSKNKKEVQQGLVLEKSRKGVLDSLFIWIRGNLFIPDPRVFWKRKSIKFLNQLTQAEDISTIITTGPPHSMHLIGLGLKKKNPKLKWLADFRDPWSDWDILPKLKTSAFALRQHRSLEHSVLQSANQVLTVSKRLAQALELKTNHNRSIKVIKNGIQAIEVVEAEKSNDHQFTIGYFGMLNELRDPEVLWDLLSKLCKENVTFSNALNIRLGGIVSESIKSRLLQDPQLKDKVTFLGYIPHQDIFEEYQRCNLLLLLLNKSDNAKWILPVKFFEYLSAGKAILSIGPTDSDLADLYQEKKIGGIYSYEQQKDIFAFVMSVFEKKYELDLTDFQTLLKENSRHEQAKKLAELLKDL